MTPPYQLPSREPTGSGVREFPWARTDYPLLIVIPSWAISILSIATSLPSDFGRGQTEADCAEPSSDILLAPRYALTGPAASAQMQRHRFGHVTVSHDEFHRGLHHFQVKFGLRIRDQRPALLAGLLTI